MATAMWAREDDAARAIEKILDGADRAFVELGVSAAGMAEIADYAGCSRRTLYRYFANRHDLHLAYVDRAARRILANVYAATGRIKNPRQRLCEAILTAIAEVRRNPGAAAWFRPGAAELAARMSRASDVVATLTDTFMGQLAVNGPQEGYALSGRWLVRVIVSFLAVPAASDAEERAMVERFVAPALFNAKANL